MAADAYREMLEALRVTEGNIRSLGPAGAIPFPYQEWLAVVQGALALAADGNQLRDAMAKAERILDRNLGHQTEKCYDALSIIRKALAA